MKNKSNATVVIRGLHPLIMSMDIIWILMSSLIPHLVKCSKM